MILGPIAARLDLAAENRQLTEISRVSDVSLRTLHRIREGDESISLKTLVTLADALNLRLQFIPIGIDEEIDKTEKHED